ncbi:MAG: hypothetical protein LCH61_00930 [Proteobacteria bacterium]|nr:hypothetical protein [Pseudomonadota bacterium]
MIENPFGVRNPEQLGHDYIARYFVDIYTDLPSISEQNNSFISGARGTGKSMLLRSLEPGVQIASQKAQSLRELAFLGIHVPLKKAEFAPPEFRKLKGYAAVAIGEHMLCQHVMYRIVEFVRSIELQLSPESKEDFCKAFAKYTEFAGGKSNQLSEGKSSSIQHSLEEVEREIIQVRQHYTRAAMKSEPPEYEGALTGFLDYVVPICRVISSLSEFSSPKLYIMMDDADNLPLSLQRVLNTWVSTRSTDSVCLKISTQLGYGTYRTLDGRVIESPHDFSEVNISTLYTSDSNRYFKKIESIARRRLDLAGIEVPLADFFPADNAQEVRLEQIKNRIRDDFAAGRTEGYGGATKVGDAVTRFAVPLLMSSMAGSSKSSHTFSYSGFESLVNLSSGVIRWFLDPASRMFDEMLSNSLNEEVTRISTSVQDKVIREWSEEFISKLAPTGIEPGFDFADRSDDDDASLHSLGHEGRQYEDLRSLLDSLGDWFRHRLLDENHGERRVFSFVLTGEPSDRLRGVLGLAVRLGYLQLTSSAPKERIGQRRPRYILAKRLGPHYKLDISGYAAHPSVTAGDLEIAMFSPKKFLASRERIKSGDADQMTIEF